MMVSFTRWRFFFVAVYSRYALQCKWLIRSFLLIFTCSLYYRLNTHIHTHAYIHMHEVSTWFSQCWRINLCNERRNTLWYMHPRDLFHTGCEYQVIIYWEKPSLQHWYNDVFCLLFLLFLVLLLSNLFCTQRTKYIPNTLFSSSSRGLLQTRFCKIFIECESEKEIECTSDGSVAYI